MPTRSLLITKKIGIALALLLVLLGAFLCFTSVYEKLHLFTSLQLQISEPPAYGTGLLLILLGLSYYHLLLSRYLISGLLAGIVLLLSVCGLLEVISEYRFGLTELAYSHTTIPRQLRSVPIYVAHLFVMSLSALSLLLYALPIRHIVRTPYVGLIGLVLFSYGTMGVFWAHAGINVDFSSISTLQHLNVAAFFALIALGSLVILTSYNRFVKQNLSIENLWQATLGHTALSTAILATATAVFIMVPTYGLIQEMVRRNLLLAAETQASSIEQFFNLLLSEGKHLRFILNNNQTYQPVPEEKPGSLLPLSEQEAAIALPDTILAYAYVTQEGVIQQQLGRRKEALKTIITQQKNDSMLRFDGPIQVAGRYYLILSLPSQASARTPGRHIFLVSLKKAETILSEAFTPAHSRAYLVFKDTQNTRVYRFSNRKEKFDLLTGSSANRLESYVQKLMADSEDNKLRRIGSSYVALAQISESHFYVVLTASTNTFYSDSSALVIPTFLGALALGFLASLGTFSLMRLIRNKAIQLQTLAQDESLRNRAVLRNSPTGILTVLPNGIIEYVNPQMATKMSQTQQDLIGKNVKGYFFSQTSPDVLPDVTPHPLTLGELIELQGKKPSFELRLKTATEELLPCSCSVSALELPRGNRFLIFVINLKEHYEKNRRIEESLAEKSVLLNEIHHRVKNNLQVISSLLSLQSRRIKDPALASIFEDSQNRVLSIALLHQLLHESTNLAEVNFEEYLRQLCTRLFQSFGVDDRVALDISTDDVNFSIDTALPCGLLVNEIVTNALKYAFPDGRSGTVFVALTKDADGTCTLRLSDDGIGFDPSARGSEQNTLGLRLINSFVAQLDGTLKKTSDGGTCYEINFSPE